VLYEKEAQVGGHARTHRINDDVSLDLGFMVFNRVHTHRSVSSFCLSLPVSVIKIQLISLFGCLNANLMPHLPPSDDVHFIFFFTPP
jgi:hypothetical protein